jgi:hypothetical protein
VDAGVFAELGVEGGGEGVATADEGGLAVAGGESFDAFAEAADARGADEDHLDGTAGEGGLGGEDGGVVLAAVGVALDGDVEGGEGALRRVGDVFGEEDAAGAGAEGGFGVDEGVEGVVEAGALEVLEESGGFAAGDDEAVEAFQLFGRADEAGRDAEVGEAGGVEVVGALQGEDADGEWRARAGS